MKLTKQRLKEIIKEELEATMNEGWKDALAGLALGAAGATTMLPSGPTQAPAPEAPTAQTQPTSRTVRAGDGGPHVMGVQVTNAQTRHVDPLPRTIARAERLMKHKAAQDFDTTPDYIELKLRHAQKQSAMMGDTSKTNFTFDVTVYDDGRDPETRYADPVGSGK